MKFDSTRRRMSVEKLGGKYVVNSARDLLELPPPHRMGAGGRRRSDVMDTIHYMSPASARSLADENACSGRAASGGGGSALPPPASHAEREHVEEIWSGRSTGSDRRRAPLKAPERTLLIIKPFAVKYEQVVERKLRQQGFQVLQRRRVQLSAEQVCDFYLDPCGELSFPYSILSSSNAPIVVMCVAAVDAVSKLKKLAGNGTIHYTWFWPKTIYSKFGFMESLHDALHVSSSIESAHREIRFFFPKMILEPLLHTDAQVTDLLSRTGNTATTLLDGLTEVCKKKPVEPILFLAEWLMLNNPNYPKVDPEIAKLPN